MQNERDMTLDFPKRIAKTIARYAAAQREKLAHQPMQSVARTLATKRSIPFSLVQAFGQSGTPSPHGSTEAVANARLFRNWQNEAASQGSIVLILLNDFRGEIPC